MRRGVDEIFQQTVFFAQRFGKEGGTSGVGGGDGNSRRSRWYSQPTGGADLRWEGVSSSLFWDVL